MWASRDHSQSDANSYYNSMMPWGRIPSYRDSRIRELFSHWGHRYIPTLTILDPNLNVINSNARSDVERDPYGRRFPWRN